MLVEILEDAGGTDPPLTLSLDQSLEDLRENPGAIERIAAARRSRPLRNFLLTVNSAGSSFATASVSTKLESKANAAGGPAYEFSSETRLIFADSALTLDKRYYLELTAGLKGLLERDTAESARVVLRILPCNIQGQNRQGFCLDFRLYAAGESGEQAELRWGLALARVQQALLFRARALRTQIHN